MYYVVYGLLYLVSLLPFWVLYLISDFIFIIIYNIWGYRKDIVMSNLSIAFPEKNIEEKAAIAKQFYRNLVDNFIETIKLLTISKEQVLKRFIWNAEGMNAYYEKGRNVQLHLGHFFNWEYANYLLSIKSKYPVLVVYMPIVNKVFNKLFLKLRSRFNAKMIAATHFRRDFLPYSNGKYCIVFVADQNAGEPDKAYWSLFFNRLAPFVTGPEKSARLNNSIVFFGSFSKLKRGFYSVKTIMLTDAPRNLKEGELTRLMIEQIEASIKENPSIYLWSHRRWKHKYRPEKYKALRID